jgi:hypothetical protein
METTTCLLSLALIGPLILVVNSTEVGDDDGNGQGNDEHSAQRADAAHHFAGYRFGNHVAVPFSMDKTKRN